MEKLRDMNLKVIGKWFVGCCDGRDEVILVSLPPIGKLILPFVDALVKADPIVRLVYLYLSCFAQEQTRLYCCVNIWNI
jgi:hypothetical protein